MTTLHPALPETYVVEVNPQSSDGFIRIPVMAWVIEEGRPLPMTLNGKHTLIGGGTAVLFPGGMVEHPDYGLAFESVEAWLDSNPGKRSHTAADLGPKSGPTKVPGKVEDEGDDNAYDIRWTGKPFKSNSWWHYDDGEYEFVFQIDGGEVTPKPTAKIVKIKRTDFQELKKELDVLDLEDVKSANPIVDASEPEEEEEDDDADDLL